MSACKECGWAEPGYSCDGKPASWAYAPGCKLKLIDLSDKIMDALGNGEASDPTLDAAYDAIIGAIEEHFSVKF